MKLIKQLVLGTALFSAAALGSAHAATVTVDGSKGQSLLVTLSSSFKNSVLSFTGTLLSGAFGDWEIATDSLGKTLVKTNAAKGTLSVQLKQSGSAEGVFTFTPVGGSVVKFDNFSSTKGSSSFQVAVVPEPETYALLALGLLGLGVANRRKVGQKAQPTALAAA